MRAFAIGTVVLASIVAACSTSAPTGEDSAPIAEAVPTFAGTIQALVQNRCQRCHGESGIAPFSLTTYEQVKAMGSAAKDKVVAREMPPWGAFDDASCKVSRAFKDNLAMTDAEIATFVKWVDAGMPAGDLSRAPKPRAFPAPTLEGKTHSFTMAAPYQVLGGGKDDIRCFPIDPGFAEDTWVSGTNVAPGDKRVVHHAIVFLDPEGQGAAKADASGSYPCFGGPQVDNPSLLLSWAPGVAPTNYPDEVGMKIPKGARLVMQVHYHPIQETVVDHTAFELRTRPDKPPFVAQLLLLGNARSANGQVRLLPGPADPPSGPAFLIPANASGHTEAMEVTIPEKIQGFPVPTLSLLAAGSHMHWAGVNLRIEIARRAPSETDPASECLLGTPKYNFNWQRGYAYDTPIERLPHIGPGDTLRFTCTYDNTMENRYVRQALSEMRVSAPKDIGLGESTLDEMCLGALVTIRPRNLLD